MNHDAYLLRDLTKELLQVGRLWRRIARQEAARHGVSEAASSPLLWIDRLGPPVRQNVLADAVGIESPSLVPLLRELESAGLIDRVADPTDRRAKAVSLTPKGEQVVAAVNTDLEALRRHVFADVTPADLEATGRVFAAIRTAAEKN